MAPAEPQQTLPASPGAVAYLWEALEASTDRLGAHHSETLAIAHTLAISLWHAGDMQNAATILNKAVDRLTSSLGINHPATLAAKGDFAAILFELGRDAEGSLLESEALESARAHLGKVHSVTTVLAWNRALNCERSGDLDTAREIITSELTWLLTESPLLLEEDQNTIRTMLAERLEWDDPPAC
jgi:hypothetical protein